MSYPNTLVFIDFPTGDVDAANEFYSAVFNWEVEERVPGLFHRIVPGQNFKLDDGTPVDGQSGLGFLSARTTRSIGSSTRPNALAAPSCGATISGPNSEAPTHRSGTRGVTRLTSGSTFPTRSRTRRPIRWSASTQCPKVGPSNSHRGDLTDE